MGSEVEGNRTPNAPVAEESNAGGKGKGVAKGESDQEATRKTDGDSVVSRLGKSAAELSRSVFQGAPSASDLARVSTSGKTGASSSSSKFDARAESSSTAATSSSSGTAAFRSGQADAHVAAEEAAFSDFLDSTSVFIPTEPTGLEKAWEASSSETTGSATHRSSLGVVASSVAEQQERDGVEVVRLLSQMDDEVPEYDEPLELSQGQLRNLRHALFEDESPAQMSASDWNNMLNFIPDFLRGPDGSHLGTDASESSLMSLGLTDAAEAGQQWLGEWNRVLTSYNDEVWGDLGDLVQQARTEVQKIKDSQEGQPPDPTALRRLRTVLTRVRARL